MNQAQPSIAELYDQLLGGLYTRPRQADRRITFLTKLEFFAAFAPKQIPNWFDFYVAKPPMPEPPGDGSELPKVLQPAIKDWLRDSENWDLNDYLLLEEDQQVLTAFQDKWLKYLTDSHEAELHFQMIREFQWPWFWARQMLHHGETA